MTLEDDLKRYEVSVGVIPVWYFETIREFIVHYCPDLHKGNKALLLELLKIVENDHKRRSNVVELKRKTV